MKCKVFEVYFTKVSSKLTVEAEGLKVCTSLSSHSDLSHYRNLPKVTVPWPKVSIGMCPA